MGAGSRFFFLDGRFMIRVILYSGIRIRFFFLTVGSGSFLILMRRSRTGVFFTIGSGSDFLFKSRIPIRVNSTQGGYHATLQHHWYHLVSCIEWHLIYISACLHNSTYESLRCSKHCCYHSVLVTSHTSKIIARRALFFVSFSSVDKGIFHWCLTLSGSRFFRYRKDRGLGRGWISPPLRFFWKLVCRILYMHIRYH